MWIVERYLRWGLIFVALWGIVWIWSSFGCTNVNTAQMEPYLVRDSFIYVRNGVIFPDSMTVQQDVVQFECALAKEKFSKFVARVIGKPGDRIWIKKGSVYRAAKGSAKEEPLPETYIRPELQSPPTEEFEDIIVPRDCYWLMGDNRKKEGDKDSRRFGPIQVHAVDGKTGKTPLSK
jgi:signal peptidase I